MISEVERRFYEGLQIPAALFSFENGSMRVELVTDGLCSSIGARRKVVLESLSGGIYGFVHPDDREWMMRAIDSFLKKLDGFDVVFRNKRLSESGYRIVHAVANRQRMEDGTELVLLIYLDMQDPEGKLGQLFSYHDHTETDMIYKDRVTGLYNLGYLRQFSDERLKTLRSLGKKPMLVYCDVRSLHSYNTQYGYEKGDELMRIISLLLKDQFPGAMVCRGADDHFIIVDEYTDDNAVAERLNTVNSITRANAYGVTVGIHAGVCRIAEGVTAAIAVDRARRALKETGDDLNAVCSFYSYDSDEKYWLEQYIVKSLDEAMEKRWIKPFYQGIVRTENEKITLLEALARWIDPVQGMISPGEFIPVLSRYHLLHKLDLYMADEVCREFGLRGEGGLPLIPVSVNFSAQDFDYVDVIERLNAITAKHGVERDKLIVEITEQDLAKGTEHFKSELKKIRENGYRLWIDDFGSGYSSLNVFSLFTIDRIKFDMDLVRNLDANNGANRRILRAFVRICREIGVHTLAEGVETKEQLDFLKEIDCEMAQGFYFFKPQSLESSLFKFRNGTRLPHETAEERVSTCSEWLARRDEEDMVR